MLRRTLLSRVHLFTALVPNVKVQGPHFLSADEVATAKTALEERKDFLDLTVLAPCFEALGNIESAHMQRDTITKLSKSVDALRAQLYRKDNSDPRRRLELHEAIMAAGFYERAINVTQLDGEGLRYVMNHYNFDVRRDLEITSKVHETLLAEKTTTAESDQLLRDLLQLERRLAGPYRFSQSGGRRWFTLGMPLSEITTEAELSRLMELEVIKSDGNLAVSEADASKLWKTVTVKPQPETFTTFAEAAGLFKNGHVSDMNFDLRVEKPAPELDYWEKLREKLLQYWVLWFAIWVSFFMVDEEIITLVALIFLKHKQTKILEEEAEKNGGKVYVASATGRAHA